MYYFLYLQRFNDINFIEDFTPAWVPIATGPYLMIKFDFIISYHLWVILNHKLFGPGKCYTSKAEETETLVDQYFTEVTYCFLTVESCNVLKTWF